MRLITNKTSGEAVLHFTATEAGVVIVGNNSVSNVATETETVNSATINQVFFGSTPGETWTISRGSNVVAVLDSTGWKDYAGNGLALKLDATADLSVTLSGAGSTGYLIIEMQKQSDVTSNDYLVG